MNISITRDDIAATCRPYGIDPLYVEAVAAVEAAGSGYLPDGSVKILFEGHVFWKRLEANGINPGKYRNPSTADILYQRWTKAFYKGGSAEHGRLDKAARIHDMSAYESASWGKFQIMGYHAKRLGYKDAMDMAGLFTLHEKHHLDAFMRYCKAFGLIDELQRRDSVGFARGYNGPGYAANKYDQKIDLAYKKLAKTKK